MPLAAWLRGAHVSPPFFLPKYRMEGNFTHDGNSTVNDPSAHKKVDIGVLELDGSDIH